MSGGGAEGEKARESQAVSTPSWQSPVRDFISQTMRSRPEPKLRARRLTAEPHRRPSKRILFKRPVNIWTQNGWPSAGGRRVSGAPARPGFSLQLPDGKEVTGRWERRGDGPATGLGGCRQWLCVSLCRISSGFWCRWSAGCVLALLFASQCEDWPL